MMEIGLRLRQTRPTSWLVERGATGGFYVGLVVDFDDYTVVIATDSPGDRGREVAVPRFLFDERTEVEKWQDGFDAALMRRGDNA